MAQSDIPRPEHPRPDWYREDWLNLNGKWDFAFDPEDRESPADIDFDRWIMVPYPWQSELSGVESTTYTGTVWYRRTFTVPESWGDRVWLNFGAVDYIAEVWVNRERMGDHEGGYSPFAFDITDALQPGENAVTVRVHDPADLREIPHGKQRSDPRNPWHDVCFTTTSGIWQTVWLEARPASYVEYAHITPDVPGESAHFDASIFAAERGDYALRVEISPPEGEAIIYDHLLIAEEAGQYAVTFDVPIESPILWDIREPNLYDVTLTLNDEDAVSTYFGMRSIEARDGQVWLNGRPVYLMTALDQGYWPGGIYTAPTDDALRWDVQYALDIGLNGLRKHIKIEDPRFAYWADKLGLLLWNDAPGPVRFNEVTRERMTQVTQRMIERDYNHPSIVIWAPYNESWGLEYRGDREVQEYLMALYDKIKAWDPSRLVVDNSGWIHVKTDIADSHKYTGDPSEWRGYLKIFADDPMSINVLGYPFYALGLRWDGEPLMVSEYGTGWRDDRSWGIKWLTDAMRRQPGIVGYTYTELYDIEHEICGYTTYDRTPKKHGYDLAALNSPDLVVFDPHKIDRALTPGDDLEVPVSISTYGKEVWSGGVLRWWLEPVTCEENAEPLVAGEFEVAFDPYTVTELPPVRFAVPDWHGAVKLWAEVRDESGQVRTRNYIDFEIYGGPLPAYEEEDGQHIFRIAPAGYADHHWAPARPGTGPALSDGTYPIFAARSRGYVEYALPLPEGDAAWEALTLTAEVGSRPPEVVQAREGEGHPSDVTVSINGVEIATWHVPDRPVHSGGALTRLNSLGSGEHGYCFTAEPDTGKLTEIKAAAKTAGQIIVRFEVKEDAQNQGGLSLFGARSGKYGKDPVLSIRTAK